MGSFWLTGLSNSQFEPFEMTGLMLVQLGWCLKMSSRVVTGLDLDPQLRGDPCWAWSARCRSPPNLCMSKMKFLFAALVEILNSTSGYEGWWHGFAMIFSGSG
jgi:hypothetical protein